MEFKMWLEGVKDTEEFKQWFGDSLLRDENGPIPVYHGTQKDPFDKFDMKHTFTGRYDPSNARKVISFAFSMDFARRYSGDRSDLPHFPHGRVIKAYLKVTNPFDFRNPQHRRLFLDYRKKALENWVKKEAKFLDPDDPIAVKEYVDKEMSKTAELLSQGHWAVIEGAARDQLGQPAFLQTFGFDSIYTKEQEHIHIHVLKPEQIWIVKQIYIRDE